MVARVSDTLRKRASARTGDFQEVRIRGDLIEHWQKAFGFGQEAMVHVRFESHQGVIDSEAIILGLALQQNEVFLLSGQPFEDFHELGGRGIESVIKRGLVHLRAILILESFLAEICNFLLDVDVGDCKVIERAGQSKDSFHHGGPHFERLGIRIFVKLADVVSGFPLVVDFDFNEFGSAAFENSAVRDRRAVRTRADRRDKKPRAHKKKQ